MATRSRIGIEHPSGVIESIYCHWDGYLDHNGQTLNDHYQDRDKVEKLIALGDISSLQKNVVPEGEHSWQYPDGETTVAYHRDRGEEFCPGRIDPSLEAFFLSDFETQGYIFTQKGEWLWQSSGMSSYMNLKRALDSRKEYV